MRTFSALIITLSLLACACRRNDAGHLPPKQMQQVLMDISLAESYCIIVKDSLHHPGSKNIDSLSSYYNTIFAHYRITPAQFTQSLDYYKGHPDDLDTMYSNMVGSITSLQGQQGKKL